MLRPADDAETAEAWRRALERTDGPTALILSRQSLPQLDPTSFDDPATVATVEILATGSEVSLAAAAAERLRSDGIAVRVRSVLDRTHAEPDPSVLTVSLEAGSTSGWTGHVDLALGIDRFGDSGPGAKVMAYRGFTAETVASRIRELVSQRA